LQSLEQERQEARSRKVFRIDLSASTEEIVTNEENSGTNQHHARNLSNPILSLTTSKSDAVKISDINPATESIVEDEDDELLTKQEWLMTNPQLENRIPVKLVITDMHFNNKGKRTIRSIVSPILSNFTGM
jgi:hypothetical protein